MVKKIISNENNIIENLIGFSSNPKLYIAIISLSRLNFRKQSNIPKTIINGIIIDIILGIKKNDRYITLKMSTWTKLVKVNNLVTWSNQAIEIKIKKIKVQDLTIW